MQNITRFLNPLTYVKIPIQMMKLPSETPNIPLRSYNLNFEFTNTKDAWNKYDNMITKIFFSTFAALSDLFRNFFALSVNSLRTFFVNRSITLENVRIDEDNKRIQMQNSSKLFKLKHYAVGYVKVAGYFLGIASAAYILGSAILLGQQNISKLVNINLMSTPNKVVKFVGEKFEIFGRWVGFFSSLSLTVPSYAILIKFPKYIWSVLPENAINFASSALTNGYNNVASLVQDGSVIGNLVKSTSTIYETIFSTITGAGKYLEVQESI
jgi:hypothetical protein